ncbi:hypothetical protein VPH35_018772 [Triticum aestivum]
MASALDRKPPPDPHAKAAGRPPGPGQEARAGDGPPAGPGRRRGGLLTGGGAGGAPGQGPRIRVAAEHPHVGDQSLRKPRRRLRAVRRVLAGAAQDLRGGAAERAEGQAVFSGEGQGDHVPRQQRSRGEQGRPAVRPPQAARAVLEFGNREDGVRGDVQLRAPGAVLAVMDEVLKHGTGLCVGDLFPSLWFVDVVTGLRGRLWRARRQQDEVLDKIISQSEVRQGDHVLSSLLSIRDKGEMELDNVKAIIMDMFSAGTETTSSAAEWVMSDLMRNPEVMMKAQAEVRRTFDNKSSQDHEGHIVELHYTKMVIKESMRLHPVLPLLIPRVCRETCDVGGFEVTEGTRVMVNTWALGRDPEYWHEPEEFRPERFEDGTATYKGSRFDYLPFGSGRRICPGDTFGVAVLELIMARLLYYFDWSLPAGVKPSELDMEMIVTLTSRRKNQLHLVATPYKACLC